MTDPRPRTAALDALVRMSLLLNGASTQQEVVDLAAEGAREVTAADGVAVIVLSPAGGYRSTTTGQLSRLPPTADDSNQPVLSSPTGATLGDGRPRWFSDRRSLLGSFPAWDPQREGSWAAVPLTVAGDTFGVIWLEWDEPRRLDPDLESAVAALAGLVAQAHRNTLLTARERAIAERLQRALLPELPQPARLELASAYQAASSHTLIGGDWYDVVERTDGSVALMIGDVSGHGIEAATHTAEVRHTLRAFAYREAGPAEALAVTAKMLATTRSDFTSTALVAEVSTDRSKLRVASAGHPPLLLRRASGAVERIVGLLGPPLRSDLPRPGARTEPLDLGHGDILVLYTDGVIERRGEPIDTGINSLAELVARTPVGLSAMLTEIVKLAGDREDDLAILAVRVA